PLRYMPKPPHHFPEKFVSCSWANAHPHARHTHKPMPRGSRKSRPTVCMPTASNPSAAPCQSPLRLPSHDYGMVGFVKQLVDECGRAEVTNPKWADSSSHGSTGVVEYTRFTEMLITLTFVMITKVAP